MDQLQQLLDAAREPNSKNQLTLACVRSWLAEYLQMHADEIERFPDIADASHWDLVAADYDTSQEAMFLAAFFRGGATTFLAGRGNVPELRDFAQNTFPDPDCVLGELAKRFSTGDLWSERTDAIEIWTRG